MATAMGYGAAIAVILFAIMLVFISFFLWKMWRDERGIDRCFPHRSNAPPPRPAAYKVALPIALILWLLPLLGVAMTSIRPQRFRRRQLFRLAVGFESPSQNYAAVFTQSRMRRYLLNSLLVTVPTVMIRSRCPACGLRAGIYRFKWATADLLPVRGRQFRAVPDPDGAGARSDRGTDTYDTITGLVLFHASPSRPGSARCSCAISSRRCPMS
jgi:hypothetical protein